MYAHTLIVLWVVLFNVKCMFFIFCFGDKYIDLECMVTFGVWFAIEKNGSIQRSFPK